MYCHGPRTSKNSPPRGRLMRKLKIAIGATLHKKSRRNSTSGTEEFAYFLARELVKKGHEVRVFASGDSDIIGNLSGISSEKDINKVEQGQRLFYGFQLLESNMICHNQDEFDIIHINYFEPFLFTAFSQLIKKPVVYTVHSDIFVSPDWQKLTSQMVKPEDKFIFVSKNAFDQAKLLTNRTYIYNGIDTDLFPFSPIHGNYLLWLGRIRKKKGIKEAIEAAVKADEQLIISGVIDNPEERLFYENEIKPLIKNHHKITEVGPSSFEEKIKLYKQAKGFLFPVTWEEPFGLTMVEAMACGTPVIGFKRGAVSEIIDNGVTGYVVNDVSTMADKIKQLELIDRVNCRARVEEKFSLDRMVNDYESLYYSLV